MTDLERTVNTLLRAGIFDESDDDSVARLADPIARMYESAWWWSSIPDDNAFVPRGMVCRAGFRVWHDVAECSGEIEAR